MNTPFHSASVPPLPLRDFLERCVWSGWLTCRIYRYFNCSGECYVLSLIYIDRLIKMDSFVINSHSVYRVIITSYGSLFLCSCRLMLAAKYFDDVYYTNAFYADVGGINPDELNMLEVDFLCKICFNLYVTPQEYQKYYDNLKEHCSFLCPSCSRVQLPPLLNCTPFDETPLLRYRKQHSIPVESCSSLASDVFSPTDCGASTWSSAAEYCSVPWNVRASQNSFSSQGMQWNELIGYGKQKEMVGYGFVRPGDVTGYSRSGDVTNYSRSGDVTNYFRSGDMANYLRQEQMPVYLRPEDLPYKLMPSYGALARTQQNGSMGMARQREREYNPSFDSTYSQTYDSMSFLPPPYNQQALTSKMCYERDLQAWNYYSSANTSRYPSYGFEDLAGDVDKLM